MRPIWVFVLLLAFGAGRAVAEPPAYQVVDIGSLVGMSTFATALNDQGHVVGQSAVGDFVPQTGTPYHAFLYADGVMTDLDPSDQFFSTFATDINEGGEVVGYVQLEGLGFTQSFFYSDSAGFSILNPFGVHPLINTGHAFGINEAGQITGLASNVAFLLSPPATPAENLTPDLEAPFYGSSATALNDTGLVVGILRKSSFPDREDGFVREGMSLVNLDLEHAVPGATFVPTAVNDAGDIVGYVYGDGVSLQATVFALADWSWTNLGSLDGGTSFGYGINSAGDVVGTARLQTSPGDAHAFFWQDGEMHDLNDLLVGDPEIVFVEGRGINDQGQIAATGYYTSASAIWRSFLLTPDERVTLIGDLIDFIDGLDLPKGTENSLLVKLRHAIAAVKALSLTEACNVLDAFINQVSAQAGKKIPAADAAEAIAQATTIREILGCS